MGWLGSPRRSALTRLHNLSLTGRLVTVVVLLVLTAYIITTALTAALLRDYLTDRTDSDLSQSITPLAQQALGTEPSSDGFIMPNPYYLLITSAEGATYEFSVKDPGQRPDFGDVPVSDPRIGAGPFTAESHDGETKWRVLLGRFSNGEGTVAVALPLAPITSTVRQLFVLTTVVGMTTLLAVALLAWFAVRRAFRPLRRIEDTAAAIAGGDLTRRIPQRNAKDEVASLSDSLNVMLARIEQAFVVREASEERMRQFVADASHELRTPLATVKGYAELYRVGGVTDADDVATAMRRIEDESSRMARLVEDLLLLIRLDTAPDRPLDAVDLTVLANDIVQDARVRTPHRPISLRPYGSPNGPVVVAGDDFALRQVLTNLVANALVHTPADSPIDVLVGSAGPMAVVEVQDHGPGIPPNVAERVFERFFRADPSRSRSQGSGGTGLGLSIVASIAARHGGTVRHRPTPGGGATFRIEIPRKAPVASVPTGSR